MAISKICELSLLLDLPSILAIPVIKCYYLIACVIALTFSKVRPARFNKHIQLQS